MEYLETDLKILARYIEEERFTDVKRQAMQIKNNACRAKKQDEEKREKWMHIEANMVRVLTMAKKEEGKEELVEDGIPGIDVDSFTWDSPAVKSESVSVTREDTMNVLQRRVALLEQELEEAESLLLEMYRKQELEDAWKESWRTQ